MKLFGKNMMNQQSHIIATEHFITYSGFFPSDSSYDFRERQDELTMPSAHSTPKSYRRHRYETEREVSFNDTKRKNALHQASAAQMERMKNYLSSSKISSQSTNYELVKRLESIAANHCTSVPVIVKSWNTQKKTHSGSWCLEDLVNDFENGDADYYFDSSYDYQPSEQKIRLSQSEISLLNAAVV